MPPIRPAESTDLLARIEALLNERHANLADQTTAVVAGLHEDLVGLDARLDRLASALEAPVVAITELRAEVAALRERIAALEVRPPCALMTTRGEA